MQATSTAVAVASQPKPPSNPRQPRLSARMKRALDLMVWDCKTDNEAAVETGMTVTNIRLALKQPHGRAYYRGQIDVLRQRESAANIHALLEVRNQKSNQMARVQAVKALEQIGDAQANGNTGHSPTPGVVIQILTSAPVAVPVMAHDRAIDVKSLITNDVVQHDE